MSDFQEFKAYYSLAGELIEELSKGYLGERRADGGTHGGSNASG